MRVAIHNLVRNAFNVDVTLVLSYLQWCAALTFLDEQVINFFHVDLDHVHRHLVLHVWISVRLDALEDFIRSLWHDATVRTIAEHRVRFARACLAVSKHGDIKSSPRLVKHAVAEQVPRFGLVAVV